MQTSATTSRSRALPWALALPLCLLSMPAWAYIDPNAGGLLYQLLFPLLVAIGTAWATLRHHIRAWWDRLRGRTPPPPQREDQQDPRDGSR